MEVDKPPSKLARFSEPGLLSMGGPSTGLGLGLGTSRNSPFTFLQLQELEHQAAIYNYMAAAVPVPFHLVLPIWKSVAGSCSGLYNHYPSWPGCGSLCYDYRNSMEPEPGRCRRTDGKKWRCSKEVVPDQKYCERHMHRGRHRSRKPVEGNAALVANSSDNLTTITTTLGSSVLASRSGGDALAGNFIDSNTQLSISMPGSEGLHLMTPTGPLHSGSSHCKVETSTL